MSPHETPADAMDAGAQSPYAILDDVVLARHLGAVPLDFEQVLETASTNADLLERARACAPGAARVLRVAQHQTQGRGRRGRRWHGSAAGSLLFSLALPWSRDPAGSAAVTLACGLAAAAVLQEHLDPQGTRLRVKWPNDLLLDDAKLAGILVEMAEDAAGARTLVIGMGINLCIDGALRDRIAADQAAAGAAAAVAVTDLASVLGAEAVLAGREAWLARLARALLEAAQRYARVGFAGGPAAFADCCAYQGSVVDVQGHGGSVVTGIVRGVDEQGQLLLERDGALQAVNSGEVSVRRGSAAMAVAASRADP